MIKAAQIVTKALALTAIIGALAPSRHASAIDSASPGETDTKPAEKAPGQPPTVKAPAWKVVSPAERDKQCRTFEGTFISYYGDIFKVENCKRRAIRSQNGMYDIVSKVKSVVEVESRTIAAIPEGRPLDDGGGDGRLRTCKDLEGKYVTHSYVEVFFVDKCRPRLLPDWETYISHRGKTGDEKGEIIALTSEEFEALKPGKELESVITKEFEILLRGDREVDVIPVDEACRGLEGLLVGFYSRLYKIEKCRKREIDPDALLESKLGLSVKIKDLTAQQWLSLPNGKPFTPEPAAKPKAAETKKTEPR